MPKSSVNPVIQGARLSSRWARLFLGKSKKGGETLSVSPPFYYLGCFSHAVNGIHSRIGFNQNFIILRFIHLLP